MNAPERDPARTWEDLQAHLAGSFTARTRSLLAPEILLSGPHGEFGRMTLLSPSGAEISAENLNTTIEHTGKFSYRILAGETSLVAEPTDGPADFLEIRAGNLTYGAAFSFFRNRSKAISPEGKTVAQLMGSLIGRRYTAGYDPETPAALPVAMLLLYHIATNRGRAYQME